MFFSTLYVAVPILETSSLSMCKDVWSEMTCNMFSDILLEISTIWLFNIAMENDPFIDGLPIKNGDFPWLC
jgi:hypothetical protein